MGTVSFVFAETWRLKSFIIMTDPNQPRQPKDMKGLLRFCVEATKNEDAPDLSDPEKILNDMDPEKRKWLEEALNSMSVDIVEQLVNGIKILKINLLKNSFLSYFLTKLIPTVMKCVK